MLHGNQGMGSSGRWNRRLEAELWSKLKLLKIIVPKLFFMEIKVWAALGLKSGSSIAQRFRGRTVHFTFSFEFRNQVRNSEDCHDVDL